MTGKILSALKLRYFTLQKPMVLAVKILKESKGAVELRNLRDMRNSLSQHRNIALHQAILIKEEQYYIFHDLAKADLYTFVYEAEDFDKYFSLPGCLPRLFKAIYNLADALGFLHSRLTLDESEYVGCHMDLKPENILVFQRHDDETVCDFKISDFGISRLKRNPHHHGNTTSSGSQRAKERGETTKTAPRRGTGEFMAPEMGGKKVGRAVDVWSIGCIFIVIFIRAFEGRDGLSKFTQEKVSKTDDYFYHVLDGEAELKPTVQRWIQEFSKRDVYIRPVKKVVASTDAAKGVLNKLKRLLEQSLVIPHQGRITSKNLVLELSQLANKVRPMHLEHLRGESTLITGFWLRQDRLLQFITDEGLKLYKLWFDFCAKDGELTGT